MQVIETSTSGLKRELKIVVPATELSSRFDKRLDTLKDQVVVKGFRRGKVPVGHIKKLYGPSIMAEVLQAAIDETSKQAITDRKERPAVQPKINLPETEDEIKQVLAGTADLSYNMTFEVLPDIKLVDFATLKLERLTAAVEDGDIQRTLDDLANRNLAYVADAERAAVDGDRVTITFVGRIDGEPFEGGTGDGVQVILGQGSFIPGFEDGLKGAKAGDKRDVPATFPDTYSVEHLKGKTAIFDVTVTEIGHPEKPALDDAFAKSLGADDVAKLRELVTAQLQREYDQVSRAKLKRAILDQLADTHDFALPGSLVDSEFEQVWGQLTEDMKRRSKSFEDEGKTEEGVRTEFRTLAERRVRLGLVVGEIGDKNKVDVKDEELRRVLIEQARRFPGQEKMVYEYYQNTPGAIAELRAPIFEDKVIDLIVAAAKPTDRQISREDLMKPIED
jgi:trigger factor